jgi:hypothetical protein
MYCYKKDFGLPHHTTEINNFCILKFIQIILNRPDYFIEIEYFMFLFAKKKDVTLYIFW